MANATILELEGARRHLGHDEDQTVETDDGASMASDADATFISGLYPRGRRTPRIDHRRVFGAGSVPVVGVPYPTSHRHRSERRRT